MASMMGSLSCTWEYGFSDGVLCLVRGNMASVMGSLSCTWEYDFSDGVFVLYEGIWLQ